MALMRYIKTVTATPLRQDGRSICTLMANSVYLHSTYKNAITTGWYPATLIVEVWEADENEDVDHSADEFVKYIMCGRFRGKRIVNGARRKILDAVADLQPNQFIRLRHMTPTEALYFMGVNKSDAEKMESVTSDAQIYKQAGNSIVVDVLEKIFENMFINRDSNNNLFTSKHTNLMKITNKQDVQDVSAQLSKEYATKLANWWCKAQKPNKPYVIEYEDIEDLAAKIDDHCKKAERRSKTVKPERRSKSVAEQCVMVIEDYAAVRGMDVKEVLAFLRRKTDAIREREAETALVEAKQASEAVNAFRTKHADIFAQLAQLQDAESKTKRRAECLTAKRAKKQREV